MDKNNNRLVYALQNLPPNGRRLEKGLALRITTGNGMNVLGCSRTGVEPSLTEVQTVITAVCEAFGVSLSAVLMEKKPVRREIARMVEETAVSEIHYIWRVYWPVEGVVMASEMAEEVTEGRPLQSALL